MIGLTSKSLIGISVELASPCYYIRIVISFFNSFFSNAFKLKISIKHKSANVWTLAVNFHFILKMFPLFLC